MTTAAQALIDAKVYPPTHRYDVGTLTPQYPLNERVRIILGLCPAFFRAKRFLDVGCSKGFFSLNAALHAETVFAIDPDREALESWKEICPRNVIQFAGGFKDFGSHEAPFDMIWAGNGHHYLYRENPGYVDQLAKLACGTVVIEGPTGPECPEMRNFGPYQHEADFLADMARHFDLTGRAKSPSYTPGRAVWAFKTRS